MKTIIEPHAMPSTGGPRHSSERFHALDATRAFALMLGVIFHAAWSFIPKAMGAPVVDVSGSLGFDWFFFTSHTFRMELFFLIAGFFARMLYHKRGWAGFVRHRLLRIGLPMVVGWFIVAPLMITAWTWGGNVFGRNLVQLPIPDLLRLMFFDGKLFISKSQGGMFGLMHLWFLYYLLWFCLLAVLCRPILMRAVPGRLRLAARADAVLAGLIRSPLVLLGFTLVGGIFLWRMEGWFGVDTPTETLAPSVPVLLLYGTFFGLGWLLHRQPILLRDLTVHWKWQVATGLAISILVFWVFSSMRAKGFTGPYPSLTPAQIRDWPQLLATLQSLDRDDAGPAELKQFWLHLKAGERQAIATLTPAASPDAQAGVCTALSTALRAPEPFANSSVRTLLTADASTRARLFLENRRHLDGLLRGRIIENPRQVSSYSLVKLGYSVGYSAVMFLLVFGTLGCFQALCSAHSPAWRYVSDSAYWIYLAHMVIVPFLQVWMGGWNWPGPIKFAALNAIAFGLLFASYHYLVRSTIIGQVLNGQRHPFQWLLWKRGVHEPSNPVVVPLPVQVSN